MSLLPLIEGFGLRLLTDPTFEGQSLDLPLTTVYTPADVMGQSAVPLLLTSIQGETTLATKQMSFRPN